MVFSLDTSRALLLYQFEAEIKDWQAPSEVHRPPLSVGVEPETVLDLDRSPLSSRYGKASCN